MSFTFKQVSSGEASNPSQQAHPKFISQLYTIGKYSDLIIKCNGKEFKVHRAIVCPQSKPLTAATDHGFKEATTGVINFEEDNPEIVEYMIKFLYVGTYNVFARMNTLTTPEMSQNATSSAKSHAPSLGKPSYKFLSPSSHVPSLGKLSYKSLSPSSHAPSKAETMARVRGGLFRKGADMFSSPNSASIFARTDASRDTRGNIVDFTPSILDPYREAYPTNTFAAAAGSAASISDSHSYVWGENIDTGNPPVHSPDGTFERSGTGLSSNKFCAVGLIKHVKVYIMAEKYDIQPLKTLARERYLTISKTCWDSSYFVESIEIIFDGTPEISGGDCLRNIAVETASKYVKQLLARKDFTQLCQDRGDIATSILQITCDVTKFTDDGWYGSTM